jgi:hypothetical protein
VRSRKLEGVLDGVSATALLGALGEAGEGGEDIDIED